MRTLYPGMKHLRALKGLKLEANESLTERLEQVGKLSEHHTGMRHDRIDHSPLWETLGYNTVQVQDLQQCGMLKEDALEGNTSQKCMKENKKGLRLTGIFVLPVEREYVGGASVQTNIHNR